MPAAAWRLSEKSCLVSRLLVSSSCFFFLFLLFIFFLLLLLLLLLKLLVPFPPASYDIASSQAVKTGGKQKKITGNKPK